MDSKFKKYKKLFLYALKRYDDKNVHDLGAALAYFAVFSIVPLISVLILITGAFFGKEIIQAQIYNAVQGSIGASATDFLRTSLETANSAAANIWVSIVSGAVLIFAVITITTQLQSSLDRIFCDEMRKIGFAAMLREKLATFSIVFLLAFLLLTFLVLSSGITFFERLFSPFIPFSYVYVRLINTILNILFIFGFSLINFRFLPITKLRWKSVISGAVLTSILFLIGKYLLNLYLAYVDPGSGYGAAGALLVVLLWIYYSSQILFFGASFAYACEHPGKAK